MLSASGVLSPEKASGSNVNSRGSEQANPKFNTDRTHPATMTDREVRIQQ
jgi:hypothetical protein